VIGVGPAPGGVTGTPWMGVPAFGGTGVGRPDSPESHAAASNTPPRAAVKRVVTATSCAGNIETLDPPVLRDSWVFRGFLLGEPCNSTLAM
jgi:hypothetical protein